MICRCSVSRLVVHTALGLRVRSEDPLVEAVDGGFVPVTQLFAHTSRSRAGRVGGEAGLLTSHRSPRSSSDNPLAPACQWPTPTDPQQSNATTPTTTTIDALGTARRTEVSPTRRPIPPRSQALRVAAI